MGKRFRTLIITLLAAGLALTVGCTTTQRIDALTLATELDYLHESWDRATEVVERNAGMLPEDERAQLLSAWGRLDTVREMLRAERIETLIRHPLEVERLYWEARAAYSDLRQVVAPYVSDMHPQDRIFVRRVDQSAQRLDAAAVSLLEEAGGETQVVLEMISLATSTARLAARLLL
jgi:hypothetical protein